MSESMTGVLTLTDFLLARIAEDEAAIDVDGSFGRPDPVGDRPLQRWDYDEMLIGPARMLAECEAKRRIVELHPPGLPVIVDMPAPPGSMASRIHVPSPDKPSCARCGPTVEWPCQTLRVLAMPYVDHPDYREEWRP